MGGDRFIPIRNSKQMDVASFLISKENESVDINNTAVSSVSYFDTSPPPHVLCMCALRTLTYLSFKGKPESLVYVTKWIQH